MRYLFYDLNKEIFFFCILLLCWLFDLLELGFCWEEIFICLGVLVDFVINKYIRGINFKYVWCI